MKIQLLPGTAFDGVHVVGIVYHEELRYALKTGTRRFHTLAICFGFFMIEFTW